MLYFPISNSLGVPFVIVYIGVACVQAEPPHANPNFQKDLKDFDEKKHDSLISFSSDLNLSLHVYGIIYNLLQDGLEDMVYSPSKNHIALGRCFWRI